MILLYIISSLIFLSSYVYAEELVCLPIEQAKEVVVNLEQKILLEKEVEELYAEVELLKKQNELLKEKIRLLEEQKELQNLEIIHLKKELSKHKRQTFFESLQNLGIGLLLGVIIGGLLL